MRENKVAAKIALSCKERDQTNSGQLNVQRLPEILEDNKLNVSKQEMVTLKSCLASNARGEFKIQEFLELVCGVEEGLRLAHLELGALRPGGDAAKFYTGEFKVPRATEGARDPHLNAIGLKLIQTGENYEETFITAIGGIKQTYPQINIKHFRGALRMLKIQLGQQEDFVVESFFRENQTGEAGTVQLAHLLKAFGLPP